MNRSVCLCLFALVASLIVHPTVLADSTLRVLLIPADGGTEDGTLADFRPVFSAVSRKTGVSFDLHVGQSYGAVVEAMTARLADIAFFGPVSYLEARQRGAAELLAVAVEDNASIYYAGIFVRAGSPIRSLADLRGKSVAFGDVNSTSSFAYPVAMIISAGLDPVKDLGPVRMTGSHASSLNALAAGQVDAACASFDSFEKAVQQNVLDPKTVRVLARSEPIPYPPLAMHPQLPDALKARLRAAFAEIHHAPGISPPMIRGYGGKQVDRYDTTASEETFAQVGGKLAAVTDQIKSEILRKAAQR